MTFIIVIMLVLGYLLLSSAHLTKINKAAVAMFVATVGWVVYIVYGTDFVMSQHMHDYYGFLAGDLPSSVAVKEFIYENVFLKYVGKAAEVVMFLLATMTIVEILNNNGCFDFIMEWVRTRSSKRLLWTITLATFAISANLDNLTTTTMMLVIMHSFVQSRRQRMIIGSAVLIAANTGGCFTVIGDPLGVVLWTGGAVHATDFSSYLFLPSMVAFVVPTYLLGRLLPERLEVEWPSTPYRGDDTNLNRTQRLFMLLVGIGGLWFIPTFHTITKLSPFLGALCVLSVLWVVNEAFNRKLMNADQMIQRRIPRALQYGSIQQMLFVMGIMMAMGVVVETGFFKSLAEWFDYNVHNIWVLGTVSGLVSAFIDSFTVAMTDISLYPIAESYFNAAWGDADYVNDFMQNGAYWKVIAFTTAVGGCLASFGSLSGLALMKMERMPVGWFFKNCSLKVLLGFVLGLAVLWLECTFWN